jgi:hypothetical protein
MVESSANPQRLMMWSITDGTLGTGTDDADGSCPDDADGSDPDDGDADALVFAIVSSSCNPLRSRLQHKFDDL